MRNYETSLTQNVKRLQESLDKGEIKKEEFNFLVGLAMKVELNNFIQNQVKDFSPEPDKQLTFISYARNRKFKHA